MKVNILQLDKGATQARGTTIIIDVFRAFSTTCYVADNKAVRIIPVQSVDKALEIKRKHPQFILLGERHEKKCDGFDFGNSPTHILNVDFTGKTVVQTTSSGTLGLCLATQANEILTGSFVNADAIVSYLKGSKPQEASLVCMGYEARRETQEDTFCAQYIRNKLHGVETNFEEMVATLRNGDGARLLNPKNHEHSPASDFDLCLNLNRFDFVLKAKKDEEFGLILEKIIV